MLADTEAEVSGLAEVALAELVLLHLQATLENFLGLGATDGDVHGDLFVTADTEGTNGVTGLACWCLMFSMDRSIEMNGDWNQTYCTPVSDRSAARAP